MPWTEFRLAVTDALKDAVTGELTELGASGIWETDDGELVFYFDNPPELPVIRDALSPLFEREDLSLPELSCRPVKDQDWGEQWKKSWKSFPLGRRFYVVPSWSEAECPDDREPIFIDPGQAFGTGTHE